MLETVFAQVPSSGLDGGLVLLVAVVYGAAHLWLVVEAIKALRLYQKNHTGPKGPQRVS